jgi:hypothetical protein
MSKLLNPSGLVKRYHSDKCSAAQSRGQSCVCSLGTALRKSLHVCALLKSKSWQGSTCEACTYKGRAANKVTHPSGAVAYLFADVG